MKNTCWDTPFYGDDKIPLSNTPFDITRRESYKKLTEAGYDIMMAGSSNELSFNFEHMIRYAQENLNPDKVKGMVVFGWWGTVNEDSSTIIWMRFIRLSMQGKSF